MGWVLKTNLKGPAGPVGGVKTRPTADTDLNTMIADGTFELIFTPTNWTAQHYPFNGRGTMRVYAVSTYITQVVWPIDFPRTPYFRVRTSAGVWDANWTELTGAARDAIQDSRLAALESGAPAVAAGQPTNVSGFKSVPLSLSIGLGSDGNAAATEAARIPMNWNAPIFRARFHIRNISSNHATVRAGAVDFTGLWVGKHAGNGAFTAAPAQVQGAFSTPANGDEYVSKWFQFNNTPGIEDLLSFGYTATGGTNVVGQGGQSWHNASPATASQTAPAVTLSNVCPFFIWMEAETYAGTPVVAVLGDSLSCGVGDGTVNGPANKFRVDSMLSQYCQSINALPVHYANSGDKLSSWQDTGHAKWRFFDGTSKPDALIVAMGSNDVFGGDSLATYQTRLKLVMDYARAKISPNVTLANLMPRNTYANTTEEQVRRTVNTWYLSLPNGARDVFDFAASISADDETITAPYDSDGTHLTAAGYLKNAQAITRPVTTRPIQYV